MKLPFVYLDAVWHLGDPALLGERPVARAGRKNWDYEFGLFSVSLSPEDWREGWAGAGGATYELTAPNRKLCFVEADLVLQSLRDEIANAASRHQLTQSTTGNLIPTDSLYAGLQLVSGSQLDLVGRPFADQVLQAALAVLVANDPAIDGLWWSDLLGGAMRTQRGGIHQHQLAQLDVKFQALAPAAISPSANWLQSKLLE